MAKNIEEFLKLAAARRQQGQQQQEVQIRPPQQQRQPEIVEIIDDVEIVEPRSSGVGSHVQTHIDTSDIAEHTRQLGERISSADEKVKRRLAQKFDHSVGSLGQDSIEDQGEVSAQTTTAVEAEDVPERATELIQLFRSPGSIRNAILMNEILKRPDFDD